MELIAQKDSGSNRSWVGGAQAQAEGGTLTIDVIRVDHRPNGASRGELDILYYILGSVTEDNNDLIETGGNGLLEDVLD